MRSYIEHAGLADHICHIEARDPVHVERMKPSPYLVNQAAEALHIAVGGCVLVGDQVSDLPAATAAGAPSIGYANKPGKAADLAAAGANAVVNSMASLSRLLGVR